VQDKFVFPIELGVTKLSGTGADCIFLGVAKAMPVRALAAFLRCMVALFS